jgi:ABC-type transport system involved in multi-copper enzyme maturation permease subunit
MVIVLTIARLTLREAVRRRLVIAVFILTVILAILSSWAFHKLITLPCTSTGHGLSCRVEDQKLLAATLLILLGFMFSFVLAVGGAFLGAPSLWAEMESGVLLAMLPRPIRRSEVLLGKWVGLGVLLVGYTALACGMEILIADWTLHYVPPHPLTAVAYIGAEALVVLTLAIAVSTRIPSMAGGIVIIVFFGLTWMGGIAGAVGTAFHSRAVENIGTISSLLLPTDGLWRGAIYNLEPISILIAQHAFGREASGNPFYVLSPPTGAYLVWALGWVVVVLGAGIWSFGRKEL